MQKQQILQQQSSTPGHGAAMAHRRGSPPKSNSSEDPAVSSSSASSLPFGSLPSWPQPHLLQHLPQQPQGVDGQLQSHLYVQHALQIAQRTMAQQQQQQKGSPGPSNNVKMQEFMQLQSAAMAAKQPPAQSPSGQAQRVPNSMAFLFGQQNPQRNSTQQFMSPDMMLQARMLAMQQQQQKSVESPHLRLSQHAPASEPEVTPPSSFPQQEKRPTPAVLPKPESSNSFQIAPRPQAPQVTIQQRPQPPVTGSDTTGMIHLQQQAVKPMGFTRQQLMVLRAQILAFRRLKRGDRSFTSDMIRAITPSPLQSHATVMPLINQPSSETKVEEKQQRESSVKPDGVLESKSTTNQHNSAPIEAIKPLGNVHQESVAAVGPTKSVGATEEEISNESDIATTRLPGKTPTTATRRYRGPLFDIGGSNTTNVSNVWGPPMSVGYDIRELLIQEGVRIIGRRKAKRLKVIEMLLSNENVPSELKLKLRIEQRKLVLLKMQKSLRNEIEEHQQEIMQMSDRVYRKFVRLCERQRMELTRQVMVLQKTTKEKYLKGIFLWRKKLLESHWSTRDARINRNRGVAKFHERLLREFSKRKDEDRSKRMEALKNNDVDAYREMLIKQQKEIPGDAEQRFQVLQSFLSQTEDYLHKLGGKISAVKSQQEREEAALAAAASARAQGFSEEEVERAAAQASNAVGLRSWNGAATNSVNKYYSLAHAVNEQILRQPSMLRAGVLRDYQLVGLQWMLSLYNNRLNGILADEMGLGKTVQVMALIAYLMEFKGNYGPHLIIVPNAVMVNWKSELLRWLPSVSSIFYVGVREDRSRIYSQEVAALKFNVLVTTYEFIMRDRSKLAKVDWKYIIIDEAQRMKDRESRLARDLDRFRCQRRLLLTGTPLQNDLHELWSLLNLLLPEVFDNSKAFHDWFSKPFQRDGNNTMEDDWLATEKKVIVIHRLHQILEPFMLRRRVEDVEGSLPPKVPIVLKCKLSAYQAAIYDWVKATGTIRLDPAEEEERVASGNGKRQARAYAPLQNKCMELRKVCNHPYLNYPPLCRIFNENMVRMCGKLWILDRILIKLQKSGHRVLLFSTMTKLLDILEDYLQWRGLIYRRIDGTTPLDSRETAIIDFNSPGSQCFIFLLSIRAAGRGLNLQTADTVVIYDPDPNPKNEEQAVARAHRIGQKSEVKVIYMEAVVETIPSYQKEDEIRNGGSYDIEDELAGKDRYMGSIESLVRNNIQQHKIDMADEVINAGRFDQRTTHEERRMTLEALLHDEERYQETVHDVPTLKEVNRMIARSEEEVELFDQMDEECDWPADMYGYDEVPEWLHVGTDEVNGAIKATSKQAMSKGISGISGIVGTKAEEDRLLAKKASSRKNYQVKPLKPARRGRPPLSQKVSRVVEVEEDEDLEEEVVEEEECSSSGEDEEGEIRDASEEEEDGRDEQNEVDDVEDMESSGEESMERPQAPVHLFDTKKFGSLAELGNRSQQELGEDLEEGEIAESHPESPPSETWGNENDHEDDEQGTNEVEPRSKKRKRSARHRRKVGGGNIVPVQGAYPVNYLQTWSGYAEASGQFTPEIRPEVWGLNTRNPTNFIHTGFGNWSSQKQNRSNGFQEQAEELEVREARNTRGGARMQDNVQKKCKAVLSKLQGAMNKDGRQVSALLMELPRHHELPDYYKLIDKPIDAKTIEEHLDRFDYSSVLDFASDVQLMLDNAARYHSHNAEVQADARRLHSLFFQRMGLMFPDVDFNTIKTNIGLRSSGSRSSRKQRHDPPPPPPPPTKVYDEPGTHHKGNKKGSSKRDKGAAKIDGEVYHPADLLIARRKRNNSRRKPRAKVTVVSNKRKRGNILESRDSNAREKGKGGVKSMVDEGGPLSWARARKLFITSTVASSNTEAGDVGQPRKKSRTDVGRRRPSGLK